MIRKLIISFIAAILFIVVVLLIVYGLTSLLKLVPGLEYIVTVMAVIAVFWWLAYISIYE